MTIVDMTDEYPDDDLDVHTWFSLTYANYLVWPRSLMQSMPEEWQHRFTTLAREIERAYPSYLDGAYRVQRIDPDTKRYVVDPVPHYNRGRTFVPPETTPGLGLRDGIRERLSPWPTDSGDPVEGRNLPAAPHEVGDDPAGSDGSTATHGPAVGTGESPGSASRIDTSDQGQVTP